MDFCEIGGKVYVTCTGLLHLANLEAAKRNEQFLIGKTTYWGDHAAAFPIYIISEWKNTRREWWRFWQAGQKRKASPSIIGIGIVGPKEKPGMPVKRIAKARAMKDALNQLLKRWGAELTPTE